MNPADKALQDRLRNLRVDISTAKKKIERATQKNRNNPPMLAFLQNILGFFDSFEHTIYLTIGLAAENQELKGRLKKYESVESASTNVPH